MKKIKVKAILRQYSIIETPSLSFLILGTISLIIIILYHYNNQIYKTQSILCNKIHNTSLLSENYKCQTLNSDKSLQFHLAKEDEAQVLTIWILCCVSILLVLLWSGQKFYFMIAKYWWFPAFFLLFLENNALAFQSWKWAQCNQQN